MVTFPIRLTDETGSVDDRGSAFFIYSPDRHAVVFETFGHPEWAPGAEMLQVTPLLFFRIEDDPRIYFLAEVFGAWEDYGFAICDARTGAFLVTSA